MRDKISEERIEKLHPTFKQVFRKFIEDAENGLNITLRVIQGLRTFEEQQAIYDQGRTKLVDEHGNKLGIISNAKPGQSYHQYGLAIDVCPIINGKLDWGFNYASLKQFMPKGMSWGGDWKSFKDKPHFEFTFGYTWKQLLEKYNQKDFIPGTEYVNL